MGERMDAPTGGDPAEAVKRLEGITRRLGWARLPQSGTSIWRERYAEDVPWLAGLVKLLLVEFGSVCEQARAAGILRVVPVDDEPRHAE